MLHYKAVSTKRWQKVSDIVIVVFGCVALVYTTILTVKSWVSGRTGKLPGYCDQK
jgi:proton-coupled amino acid transporter